MSDTGPTSPDDPEWVDEIVRRALERAGTDDANPPPAPAVGAVTDAPAGGAPTIAPDPEIAAPPSIAPPPTAPAAPSTPAVPAASAPSGPDVPAASAPRGPDVPAVSAPPRRAVPTTPTPAAPTQPRQDAAPAPTDTRVGEARSQPVVPVTPVESSARAATDDLFGGPATAEPARLPEFDDLASAYPLDDATSSAEVAGSGETGVHPDLDLDPRFDEAVGLGSDPDFESDPMGGRMRGFLEWGAVVVGALAVALIIKTFLMQAYFIPSSSMEPTLQIGDRVLVNKLSYDFGDIGRGDLVVFNRPPNQQEGEDDLIKRVIALEGETIEIDDGQVFITVVGSSDKQLLQEPYLPDDVRTTGFVDDENCIDPTPTTCGIPDGHVFVMGDNRGGSRDSRFFGPIPEDLVVGRAFMRVWPIGDVGFL